MLMLLNRLPLRTQLGRLAHCTSIRMSSTIVGKSGRVYTKGEMLSHRHSDLSFNIFKAESGGESFVLKRVSKSFYDLSQQLAAEFAGSRRLRMHVNSSVEEDVLIYPYFTTTFLKLLKEDPDLHFVEIMKILRSVGEALQEFHAKDWIHLDVKPDNVLVNWTYDQDGKRVVSDARLGDFDLAFKLEEDFKLKAKGRLRTGYAIGNVMWRSPEGQTANGMTSASDIYSYGLVFIYALGGHDMILLHNLETLLKLGIPPEQEVLTRHFCWFGPVPEELFKWIGDEAWRVRLEETKQQADKIVERDPGMRFTYWFEEAGENTVGVIGGVTKLDPGARLTIEEVLMHPVWQEKE